jgi:hypothetical protein
MAEHEELEIDPDTAAELHTLLVHANRIVQQVSQKLTFYRTTSSRGVTARAKRGGGEALAKKLNDANMEIACVCDQIGRHRDVG